VWWYPIAAGLGALAVLWLVVVAVLIAARPDGDSIREAVRLLPDTLRLIKRLATDRTIPFGTRLPIYLLLVYLASPIDLIPDFIPVIGYADDAVVTSVVLRWLIRRAGAGKVTEHWPGTPEGLARLQRLLRLT
jgi:uncharacterized membrane protein YkvA (DUF1232 family)